MPSFLRLLNAGEPEEELLMVEDERVPPRPPATQRLLSSYVHGRCVARFAGILCQNQSINQALNQAMISTNNLATV